MSPSSVAGGRVSQGSAGAAGGPLGWGRGSPFGLVGRSGWATGSVGQFVAQGRRTDALGTKIREFGACLQQTDGRPQPAAGRRTYAVPRRRLRLATEPEMRKYTDADGIEFADEDIERWAAEAESEEGYTGGHLGPSRPGRPVSVGEKVQPFTLRLDNARRAKLDRVAHARQTTVSQLMRELGHALWHPSGPTEPEKQKAPAMWAVPVRVRGLAGGRSSPE